MALIVDSAVFVTMERRGMELSALVTVTADEPLAMASITVSELMVGIHRADSPSRRLRREAFIQGLIESLPILAFDLREARIHAQIRGELTAAGRIIGPFDLIIAATALANGHAVLTENLREFERVPGLLVRQPAW